ncbi:hypothetical protein HB662_00325 [Roseomonas frigidaquae]|uniref:Uncharacterized protein n=1 Tax=Falsiroseomonas frigidaquae TaxID=487318 RepID=A0ABX1ERJ3_9PROT|nr:hypothetical protein [Falsiroseomonas frigidaquae]NKE43202.1 hypothetical protein [Falsiroseomonas frigidaquae]
MLSWLTRHFPRPLLARPLSADPAEFGDFLARQAAFLAQKPLYDYCKVKAGRGERMLFEDAEFQAALAHCRWQTLAGATLDILAVAEGWLRPHATGAEPALAAALAALGRQGLREAPAPPEERADLDSVAETLEAHLLAQQVAPPAGADRLPMRCEPPLMATLPIHPDQRRGETPAIRGALRFHLVAAQQMIEKSFDPAPLAARLVGR